MTSMGHPSSACNIIAYLKGLLGMSWTSEGKSGHVCKLQVLICPGEVKHARKIVKGKTSTNYLPVCLRPSLCLQEVFHFSMELARKV